MYVFLPAEYEQKLQEIAIREDRLPKHQAEKLLREAIDFAFSASGDIARTAAPKLPVLEVAHAQAE